MDQQQQLERWELLVLGLLLMTIKHQTELQVLVLVIQKELMELKELSQSLLLKQ
uniref:Major head protein n=1 Tax=uncultured marine virus TaxID=186617 RepID=A0A0F7L5B9_9VIRU|nr:major head protein [uncultured marine virus]